MISIEDARRILLAETPTLSTEKVSVAEASDRVLAQAVHASFPQPRFSNAAMDGFGVRAADVAAADREHPVVLRTVGVVAAGSSADFTLRAGECAQVMTGAEPPAGADAVVAVEQTSGFDSEQVQIYEAARPGQHMRVRGEEIAEGDLLLSPGMRIGPGELGALATFGHGEVEVHRQPRVSVLATGDELREPGETLAAGQIYNSNLPTLVDLTGRAGARIACAAVVRDEKAALRQSLERAAGESDLIVASGGVSMGRFDHVREIITELGFRDCFWKVAQKPGKPLFFATRPGAIFFGLPGNPISAFISFMEYVWPTLERMQGLEPAGLVTARLTAPYPCLALKHRFLFGWVWMADGTLLAAPSKKIGSHMSTASISTNCILGAPPGDGPLEAGATIRARLLPWTTIGTTANEARES